MVSLWAPGLYGGQSMAPGIYGGQSLGSWTLWWSVYGLLDLMVVSMGSWTLWWSSYGLLDLIVISLWAPGPYGGLWVPESC